MVEHKQGNFVAVTSNEPQLANFHTAIYEDDAKGLLIALCNQNGKHPHQAQLLLNGLDGKRQAAEALETLVKERDALDAECQQSMLDICRERERAEKAEAERDTLAQDKAELLAALTLVRDNNRRGVKGLDARDAWAQVNALLARFTAPAKEPIDG